MVAWYNTMLNTQTRPVTELIEAKATDWGGDIVDEVLNSARKQGLI
jgi:hypothetical protein